MTFNSIDALEKYILSRSKVAIEVAREKVYDKIAEFLFQFYEEFTPDVYVRTYQLLCSLVKTNVVSTGNGWTAEVYFDLGALNYATRIVPQGQPWSSRARPENTYHREAWTHDNDAWVLETAMTGAKPHGGYASGTAVWTKSMEVLNQEKRDILKNALIQAGIPVK